MTHTQPEALRLADKYEIEGFLQSYRFAQEQWCKQAAVELRRLHARNVELEAQLSAIGVALLRKHTAQTDAKDAAPAQKGWCDGCSPDNCCGCGPS